MSKRIAIYSLILFILVENAFLLSKALKADHTLNILPDTECEPRKTNFDLASHLRGLDKGGIKVSFPYNAYLDSADWCDIQCIQKDMTTLNTFNPGQVNQNQEVFYIALTDKLSERVEPTVRKYNPDSLLKLLHWAGKFGDYKDLDTANVRAYNAICSYWFGFVANHLTGYASANSSVKYQFKFRYIEGVCLSKQFQPSIGNSEFEKIILDTIDSKWSYMFKRFWYGTGFLFKALVFAGVSITLYGYLCIVQKLINTIRK